METLSQPSTPSASIVASTFAAAKAAYAKSHAGPATPTIASAVVTVRPALALGGTVATVWEAKVIMDRLVIGGATQATAATSASALASSGRIAALAAVTRFLACNFWVAGLASGATNAYDLAKGRLTLSQWVGLTIGDTAALGAVGMLATSACGGITSLVISSGGTFAGGAVLGITAALGIGWCGSKLYERILRKPIRHSLGLDLVPAAAPAA